MLLPQFLSISAEWRRAFPQQRTHRRAVRQGLGGLVCLGRRTLSRIIWTNGGEQDSWSGEARRSRDPGRGHRLEFR